MDVLIRLVSHRDTMNPFNVWLPHQDLYLLLGIIDTRNLTAQTVFNSILSLYNPRFPCKGGSVMVSTTQGKQLLSSCHTVTAELNLLVKRCHA